MLKKIFAIILCLCLITCVGCSKKNALSVEKGDGAPAGNQEEQESPYIVNPLTGLQDLDPAYANIRPVGIMINNISVAQKVQTGINQADIVYETEVEGGITRLLAIYKTIQNISQIGSVRSARYPFIDLALGHNAIYVHHGQDNFHAGPHLRDIDHFTVSENAGGARISNGLSREHTLYAYGDKLWEKLEKKFDTVSSDLYDWQKFADKDVKLENAANSVTVPFSSSYITKFVYNKNSGEYTRYSGDTLIKDYVTGETIEFKNIFVLKTTIRTYNCTGKDHYNHKEVLLESGEGYYLVNGTYTPILWEKGDDTDPMVFKTLDGEKLSVNKGTSWVCLVNSSRTITIE